MKNILKVEKLRVYALGGGCRNSNIKLFDKNSEDILSKFSKEDFNFKNLDDIYISCIACKRFIKDFVIIQGIPIFSPKALKKLSSFLIHGDIIPIKTYKGKEYFLYDIKQKEEFLDLEKSSFIYDEDTHERIRSRYLYFKEDLIDRDIFISPTLNKGLFCTNRFLNVVLEHGLKGFSANPLWDATIGSLYNKDFGVVSTNY